MRTVLKARQQYILYERRKQARGLDEHLGGSSCLEHLLLNEEDFENDANAASSSRSVPVRCDSHGKFATRRALREPLEDSAR